MANMRKTETGENGVDIKVEYDVPIPPVQRNGGRPTIYPWDTLTKVGATFFIEGVKGNTLKNAASAWSKRNKMGYKFTIRYIFVASDGKEFSNLVECKDYVKSNNLEKKIKKGTRIWRST